MAVRDDVLAALPVAPDGLRRRDVHKKVGMWALTTVGQQLALLIADGLVTTTGPKGERIYSRVPDR